MLFNERLKIPSRFKLKKTIVTCFDEDYVPGGRENYHKQNKKESILTSTGHTVDLTSARRYYDIVESNEVKEDTCYNFTIEDLLPRDYQVLESGDKERTLKAIKSTILTWRWWYERRLPHFFRAVAVLGWDEKSIKNGKCNVIMRISQHTDNVLNFGYLTTNQIKQSLKVFQRLRILEKVEEGAWSCYRYAPKQPDTCFAKGYKVNVRLLLVWMKAVKELIINPFNDKFGVVVQKIIKGDEDITAVPLPQMLEWVQLYEIASKHSTKRPNWRKLQEKCGLTAAKYNAVLLYLSTIPEIVLENLKNEDYGFKLVECLTTSEEGIKMDNKHNGNKDNYDLGKLPRHERRGGFSKGEPQFRGYSDLCLLPKRYGTYKGINYERRIDLFRHFGFEDPKEYDCPNSVHADNCYLMTGKWLEGDLYTEILPPRLKENLRKHEEWYSQFPSDEEFERFFGVISTRKNIKDICNAVFSCRTVGKLRSFFTSRMTHYKDESYEVRKYYLSIFAEIFAETYFSICGKSLGNYIFNVEWFKMLFIANKVEDDGYETALIYDCLITDKEIDKEMWTYLYRSALERYFELNQQTIKWYREVL